MNLTHSEACERVREINQRCQEITAQDTISVADQREFDRLSDEFDEVNNHRRRLEQKAAFAGAARGDGWIGTRDGGYRLEPGTSSGENTDPTYNDYGQLRGQRDQAMRQLDRSVRSGLLPEDGAGIVKRLVDTGPDHERSWVARWVTETGNAHYRSAFGKLVVLGEQRAGLEFSPAEREAFDRVARLKAEQRAMSLTDSAGGYLVPFELDPTVILTSSGSINPLLSISRVINTVSDIWHGVSSAGVTAEWLGEGSEAADASPTLGEPAISNYKNFGVRAVFC
jgi:predicted phage gp36 major capsid-like protein